MNQVSNIFVGGLAPKQNLGRKNVESSAQRIQHSPGTRKIAEKFITVKHNQAQECLSKPSVYGVYDIKTSATKYLLP